MEIKRLIFFSLFCHSLALFDGYLRAKEGERKFGYHLPPFSNLEYPFESLNFTIIRDGNFCDTSNIVAPNTTSVAAMISHGPCSLYIESQNLLAVGYKYVIIAGYSIESWKADEFALNQLVTIVPDNLKSLITGLNKTISSDLIEISYFPLNFSKFICICEQRSQYLFSGNFFLTLHSTASSCISKAISLMERDGRSFHTFQEISCSLSLAIVLWDIKLQDETRVLLKWIAMTLLSNEETFLHIYDHQIDSLSVFIEELISFLYSVGEWNLAQSLLSFQTPILCRKNRKNQYHDLCSNICSLVFVTTFGTLQSKIHSNPTKSQEQSPYSDDWTISPNHLQTPKVNEPSRVYSPLSHCLNQFNKTLTSPESIDQLNSLFLHQIFVYSNHSCLWLSANELIYVTKKFGIINVMTFLQQSISSLDNGQTIDSNLTSHLTEFTQLFTQHIENCHTLTLDSFYVATNNSFFYCPIWKNNVTRLKYEQLPLPSQNILRKNIKIGRNKKNLIGILTNALTSHLTEDMIDAAVRLAVYWDEFGAFATSQRHGLYRLNLIGCRTLAVTNALSLTPQTCVPDEETLSMNCLFERSLVATPMIFGSSDEYRDYRNQQISSMKQMFSTISWNANNHPLVLRDRLKVQSFEAQITSTPPSMMIGYQYEMQDMGDRALAPAASVLPSSFDLLQLRHHNELLCRSKLSDYLSVRPTIIKHEIKSKIRVGFISRFFYEHSVGRLIEGVITQLNQALFQTFVFCICCLHQVEQIDSIQQKMRTSSNVTWVDLQSDPKQSPFQCSYQLLSNVEELDASFRTIESHDLDLIIYPELGMDSLTIHFASRRLAPIQAVFWGHPISQNLLTIDYFLSSVLFDLHNPKCQFPRSTLSFIFLL
jgi:hypothetical protein